MIDLKQFENSIRLMSMVQIQQNLETFNTWKLELSPLDENDFLHDAGCYVYDAINSVDRCINSLNAEIERRNPKPKIEEENTSQIQRIFELSEEFETFIDLTPEQRHAVKTTLKGRSRDFYAAIKGINENFTNKLIAKHFKITNSTATTNTRKLYELGLLSRRMVRVTDRFGCKSTAVQYKII